MKAFKGLDRAGRQGMEQVRRQIRTGRPTPMCLSLLPEEGRGESLPINSLDGLGDCRLAPCGQGLIKDDL